MKRLIFYIKKYFLENRKKMGMTAVALIAILFAAMILSGHTLVSSYYNPSGKDMKAYLEMSIYIGFYLVFMIAGSIIGISTFEHLHQKEKSIAWLSFPASIAEKAMVVIFYRMVVFYMLMGVLFLLLPQLVVAYFKYYVSITPGTEFVLMGDERKVQSSTQILFFASIFHGAALVASAWFKRLAWLKAAIMIVISGFAIAYLMTKMNGWYFTDHHASFDLNSAVSRIQVLQPIPHLVMYIYEADRFPANVYSWLLLYAIFPLSCLICYFRIKEKQI